MARNKLRTGAIIQARLTSSRLPDKVLRKISGIPLLDWMMERLGKVRKLDDIVVALPETPENDALAHYCARKKWSVFRGSEDDVLSRFVYAARAFQLDYILRATADDPLIDWWAAQQVVKALHTGIVDYAGVQGCPRGTGCEGTTRAVLEKLHAAARQSYEREHVFPYLFSHTGQFKIKFIVARKSIFRPDYRLTVDTDEDLRLVRAVYRNVPGRGAGPDLRDVVAFLDNHPKVRAINQQVSQKSPIPSNAEVLLVPHCGPSIGAGHLVRQSALAAVLQAEGLRVKFASPQPELATRLWHRIFGTHQAFSTFPLRNLSANVRVSVLDIHRSPETWKQRCDAKDCRVVSFEDLSGPNKNAAIFVDSQKDAKKQENLYGGYRYAVLRKQFSKEKRNVKFRKKVSGLALLPGGYQGTLLRQLEPSCRALVEDIYVQKGALPAVGGVPGSKEISAISDWTQFQVAVTGGGISLLECACLGIYPIVVAVNRDQENNVRLFQRRVKVKFPLLKGKDADTIANVTQALERAIADISARQDFYRKARRAVDGRGVFRVAGLIRNLMQV